MQTKKQKKKHVRIKTVEYSYLYSNELYDNRNFQFLRSKKYIIYWFGKNDNEGNEKISCANKNDDGDLLCLNGWYFFVFLIVQHFFVFIYLF